MLEMVLKIPFSNCSIVMGPKVGDTMMYLSPEVLYLVIGVAGMASESCTSFSMDEDTCV